MEPAIARVLALSLIAPRLAVSLGKISFWTSAWTSNLCKEGTFKLIWDLGIPRQSASWHIPLTLFSCKLSWSDLLQKPNSSKRYPHIFSLKVIYWNRPLLSIPTAIAYLQALNSSLMGNYNCALSSSHKSKSNNFQISAKVDNNLIILPAPFLAPSCHQAFKVYLICLQALSPVPPLTIGPKSSSRWIFFPLHTYIHFIPLWFCIC